VNQIELHPFCQQKEVVKWCTENGIVVEVGNASILFLQNPREYSLILLLRQAYCPLLRGKRWDHPTLVSLAKKHGKGVEHVLVRWSLQKGYAFFPVKSSALLILQGSALTSYSRYSPLPKSSQPDRVKSNADVYDFSLSDEDMKALDALDEGDNGALMWNPIHAH
jgi:diketogulonate reductase-like aldo/keto reductase